MLFFFFVRSVGKSIVHVFLAARRLEFKRMKFKCTYTHICIRMLRVCVYKCVCVYVRVRTCVCVRVFARLIAKFANNCRAHFPAKENVYSDA